MENQLSKTHFKAQALEVMRNVEESGEPVIITSHGKKSLILSQFSQSEQPPLEKLKGSVVSFEQPTQPVADDEWSLV